MINAVISVAVIPIVFLNTFIIENLYNFQFMGINGEIGILSNKKRLSMLPLTLKYISFVVTSIKLSDTIVAVLFVLSSAIYLIQLILRFKESFYFSNLLCNIEISGLSLVVFN